MSPELATPQDAPVLALLRDEAAQWQQERGIRQWAPGEVPQAQFEEQAAAGEWHLVRTADGAVAAVRLLDADPLFWGERENTPAVYVHGLVTSRVAPRGTGAALLRWVEKQARLAGHRVVRLDCIESNPELCRYYEAQGYTAVGRRAFPRVAVVLYEKPVTSD